MALASGTRLGSYEVVEPLGAGGMGEVYRATDVDLKRQIALKVLPDSFAGDASRVARFQREAEVLATLNHPHIAQIYGLVRASGVTALAMELVEGEDLSSRILRGPLPLDEALAIARQIAEALEGAHERGIIHRDLKPSNVQVRDDGTVKVLDFGLAKTSEVDRSMPRPSDSPTLTSPAMTTPGVVLGTAAYMAPEQARGKSVDRRADLWGLGVVIFEMLTGRRAFQGDGITDTIAAVLTRDPDWAALPANTPAGIHRLLRRCLQKDPMRRLDSAPALRLEIDDAVSGDVEPAKTTMPPPAGWRSRFPGLAAAVSAMAALAMMLAWAPWRAVPAPLETRLDIATPGVADLTSFALSPDGRRLVFAAAGADEGGACLWLRDLAVTDARALAGTEGAAFPFWSPDGRSIGFFAGGLMKRLDLAGGSPQVLARAPVGRGGAWHHDGTIFFAPDQSSPLLRVSAAGGEPTAVTTLVAQQRSHRWPHLLPSGRELVYYALGTPEGSGVFLQRLDGAAPVLLTRADAEAVYLPSGWLSWVRRGTLVAQRLDPTVPRLVGEPIAVADGVAVDDLLHSAVSASAAGAIAYRLNAGGRRQLTWTDRTGAVRGTAGPPDTNDLRSPDAAPDGRRVAASRVVAGNTDVWLFEQARSTRLTFDNALDMNPIWSRDGARVAFTSTASGQADLFHMAANGSGDSQLLVASGQTKTPIAWSSDGRAFLYHSTDPQTANDLWIVPLEGTPSVFLKTPFRESAGDFSPDGRWIAYMSDQSGRMEIYVRPFTGASGNGAAATDQRQWQVSIEGGIHPTWSPNGNEIFYLSPQADMMAAPIAASSQTVVPGTPTRLFSTRVFGGGVDRGQGRQYDVTSDGLFLLNLVLDAATAPITLLQHWNPDRAQ